ncbi:MAG: ribose-phosphate pyrophosphokinase [Candidatus Krumholzibacteriia bacterium]|nr:ribose-phosphate pyrophosphokinase [bacterium]MCB9514831.1 ribose-phosphate pyrophosphokinase [Candidatus Latescibacterota bacterium]
MFSTREDLCLLTGTANRPLAERIARYVGRSLTETTIERFADGEIYAHIQENIRGVDAFIIQSTPAPADNLMELLILIDACKRASAQRVTAVIPYLGYARQDRKDRPRVAITAKLVANLITSAGADRGLTMDLHTPQIQGFFDIPLDHLFAAPVLLDYLEHLGLERPAVVAPDVGSVKMARAFAKRLHAELAIVDKRRPSANVSETMNLIGEVDGRDVVIVDDLIDTAGTLANAAELCMARGARSVRAAATHGLLSGQAIARLSASPLKDVAITNSLNRENDDLPPSVQILDVAPLLGEAIRRIHNAESVSSLFI